MKLRRFALLWVLSLSFLLLAFKQGDIVELEKFLNARSSADFSGKFNIQFVLPAGTKGQVDEVKSFPSGSAGLKINVMDGKYKGKEVWVFYDVKRPALALLKSKGDSVVEVNSVKEAKLVKTKADQPAYLDPAEREKAAADDPHSLVTIVPAINEAVKEGPTPEEIAECEKIAKEGRRPASEEGELPVHESNGIPLSYQNSAGHAADRVPGESFCTSSSTVPGDGGFSVCTNESESHGFTLENKGSSKINPVGRGVVRNWQFQAPGRARQENGLYIHEWAAPEDAPDQNDSANSMETEILFFPRKFLPSVRLSPDKTVYQVKLANGEQLLFDAKTKEIIGGVLRENAPIDTSRNRFTRKFAALAYDGKGIMVRSDQRGESTRSANVWGQKKTATITWSGKTCKVSNAEIWEQDGEKFQNRHATDDSFFAMLRSKCGWNVSTDSFR